MAVPSRLIAVAAAAGLAAFTGGLIAQIPGVTRAIVQKSDVSIPGYEAVVQRVEVAPGGVAGWHTHPGDEISYVLEGEAELLIAGQPPRKVVAGEAIVIPAGTVHNARNSGSGSFKFVGVYVVDKSKPLASPAPTPPQ
jgi:quercetin dioxygenase-like cupin family protein